MLAIVLVSIGGTLLVIVLLRAYSGESAPGSRLRFHAGDIGLPAPIGVALASILGLYLEMLLIRWISSEIRIFAYFKNFVLIACFLGFGLGCYLCRRAISIAALVVPVVFMTALIALPWQPLRELVDTLPTLLGETSEVQIWGVGTSALSGSGMYGLLLAAIVTLPLFALLAVAFIPIGQIVGYYLETAPRGIRAYTLNILGSLAGIGLYTALSFVNSPPIVWFAAAALLALILFWRLRSVRLVVAGAFGGCMLLLALADDGPARTYWSPYQKLQLTPVTSATGEIVSYELTTNSSWFQKIINVSPEFVARYPQLFQKVPLPVTTFNLPYRFAPKPRSVLVVGSGMGNDVAAALRNGAEHVTAVDIDPLIVKLGRTLHPEKPYVSPRVETVVDDGRSFLQNTGRKFDVIVFAALDSHTTSSHFSNIRIDNYIYTKEAFESARRLLTDDGVLIVRFWVERPWIAGRLHDLLVAVFGTEPLKLQSESDGYASTGGSVFVTGSQERIASGMRDPRLAAYVRAHPIPPMEHPPLATDDWPYFYQRDPGLPASVVAISVLLLVICLVAMKRIGLGIRSLRAEFFFLGGGFLLLEAQIISRMALLFGTTWIVNSIVIAVLLLLIVAANGLAAIAPRINADAAYAGILIAIAAAWLIPLQVFFFRSFWVKAVVATLFLCLPVFFAGIVFIKRFAAAGFSAEAIGSNLLGSLAGGLLESMSLWLGLRSLLVIAAIFYIAAWVSGRIPKTALSIEDSALRTS
jgi:SAM-dependent methyltransferase